MNIHEIAALYDTSIPGATLVAYEEKLFPIYIMELEIAVTEPRTIPVVAEFILKLMKEKMTDVHTLHLFLGLPVETVEQEISELASKSFIVKLPSGHYTLTAKGHDYLEDRKFIPVQSNFFTIKYDALTHELYPIYQYQTRAVSNEDDVVRSVLPMPELADLTKRYDEIRKLYVKFQESLHTTTNSLTFDDILSIANCYTQYRELNVLIFQQGETYQFKVYDQHGYYCGQYEQPITQIMQNTLLEQETAQLQPTENAVDLTWLTTKYEHVSAATSNVLTTTEHFPKMQEAFLRAKKQVTIISPWLSMRVIRDLIDDIERFVGRGGHFTIGYGYTNDAVHKRENSEKVVKFLQRRLGTRQFSAHLLGNTHQKILLCDDLFAVVGSYNWLSFRGARDMSFVSETSICLYNKQDIADITAKVQQGFDRKEGR